MAKQQAKRANENMANTANTANGEEIVPEWQRAHRQQSAR